MRLRVAIPLMALICFLTLLVADELPDMSPTSSDGRYHECGLVTEHGVTEYLDAYFARCGDPTYASDS